jgi:hypothetical protein
MNQLTPHQVFTTTETLEAILFHLSVKDLLVNSTRVTRMWKSVIDSSPTLQEALFLKPSLQQPRVFNPLLTEAFPPWFREKQERNNMRGPELTGSLPWGSNEKARDAFMRKDASWRCMLPCQPPKRQLKIVGKKNVREGIRELSGACTFDSGIRMGALYDFGIDACWIYIGSFWFQWEVPTDPGETAETGARPEPQRRIGGNTNDEKYSYAERLTVFTESSWFKRNPGVGPPEVEEEFRSKAYMALNIPIKEESRGRRWHGGFGNPPNGGWLSS